jgi:TM2 domain-containing membrane protein YozV
MKNKTTATLLAFFLGGIGIHRFYLKQPLLGVLHLIFCWTYISLIISLIDGIRFAIMSLDDFNQKMENGLVEAAFKKLQNLIQDSVSIQKKYMTLKK